MESFLLLVGTWARQHPEQIEAIIPIAIALAGAIGAFLPDNKKQINKDFQIDNSELEPNLNQNNTSDKEIEESTNSGWGDK